MLGSPTLKDDGPSNYQLSYKGGTAQVTKTRGEIAARGLFIFDQPVAELNRELKK
jgi:hypothetical protein